MNRLILLFITIFIALFISRSYATSESVQSLRSGWLYASPGAVASDYTSFCMDHDGFLWIGTDRGLMRFDGNSYDFYTHDSSDSTSISDNRILDLLCDNSGRVWVATANGLNLYDPENNSFSVIKNPVQNFYGYVIAITQQTDGTVTFIISGIGVFDIIDKKEGPVAVKKYIPYFEEDKELNSLVCGKNGKLYAGLPTGELCVIERNGEISRIKVSKGFIQDISIESDGNLIVSDVNNLYRLRVSDNSVIPLPCKRQLYINRLSNDSDGSVYIATAGQGLWRVRTGCDEVEDCYYIYSSFLNLNVMNIGDVYSASDGNLWIGCNYYGIVMIPERQLPFSYRKLSDLLSDFNGGINSMGEWNGNVLIGLSNGRIVLMSPLGKIIKRINVPGGGLVSSFKKAGNNKLLVGVTNSGVWELSLPEGKIEKIIDIPGKYISLLTEIGKADDIFVSVHGLGVMRYFRNTGKTEWLEHKAENNRLTNPYVTSMCRTHDNKIWMGLYGGLACYDLNGDSLMLIDQQPFVSGASFDVAPDKRGGAIVATSHGLYWIDPGKGVLKKYTQEDGLIENDVRSVIVDRKGGRWIGSLRGLAYQNPDNEKIISYYGGYGLVENSFNNMVYSSDNNTVFLGSNLGITLFTPDSVSSPDFDTNIKVSAIYLNGRKITSSTMFSGKKAIVGPSINPESLHLPYKDNALTLRLSMMDFRDGSNVKYVWRLKGVGDEWINSRPGENLIYLPHLDPGKYKLEIKAMENNIASEVTEIDVYVSSPWYLSSLAKILYFICFVSLLALVFILLKKKRQEQENDAKIKYFMDISHDIRSPITLILSPLESLMKEPFDDNVKIKLKTIYRNANRILSLVNQLLDIRKLEKGKMRLVCTKTNIHDFVSELVDMFKPQASEKGIELGFMSAENVPDIWIDRRVVDKILVNLISNAIKYTPKGGNIVVELECKDKDTFFYNYVEIRVIDTGIGLDNKNLDKLFERFYQSGDESGNSKGGFGIGLDLCNRLIKLHHGYISGKNREDGVKGSVFSIKLPVDKSCYSEDEIKERSDKDERIALEEDNNKQEHSTLLVENAETVRPRRKSPRCSILVVDDDKELLEYICNHLSLRYKVTGVSNGAEALKTLADNKPDLIVSDVVMPVMDGLALLRSLRQNTDTYHIPVVLLSSRNDISSRISGWDKGADAYIGKPFNVDELEVIIDNLIENRLRIKGKFSGSQDMGGKIMAPEVKGNDEILMDRIIKTMNKLIDDHQLNVEFLAKEVGISRAHLNRKIKDKVGMTPSDFIRSIRIKRACELLQKGDLEVTQVAFYVGFTSQSHFSTAFKNLIGMSPSEYRTKCIEGNIPGTDEK